MILFEKFVISFIRLNYEGCRCRHIIAFYFRLQLKNLPDQLHDVFDIDYSTYLVECQWMVINSEFRQFAYTSFEIFEFYFFVFFNCVHWNTVRAFYWNLNLFKTLNFTWWNKWNRYWIFISQISEKFKNYLETFQVIATLFRLYCEVPFLSFHLKF